MPDIHDELEAIRELVARLPAVEGEPSWRDPAPNRDGDHATIDSGGAAAPALPDRYLGVDPGQRVLLVGPGAESDAEQYRARGAAAVTVLTSDALGATDSFDLVHCADLLHRTMEPVALLGLLRRLTRAQGRLIVGLLVLADPEHSEYLRLVPGRRDAPLPGLIPGRLAVRWMLADAGFALVEQFDHPADFRSGVPLQWTWIHAEAVTGRERR